MSKKTGLVLTGGGARGAYQAGVLRGIAEILGSGAGGSDDCPFPIITGVSAGAINAGFIGARSGSFSESTRRLCEIWNNLSPADVIKTSAASLGGIGLRWLRDLTSGGKGPGERVTHLLDSAPLRGFLEGLIDFEQMQKNIATGGLHGICFTATSYRTGTAISFYDGSPGIPPWSRSARLGKRSPLTIDHILASASIPIFFRPVRIGNAYYGDGGIRLSTPLSPAIHLGADRVLAIGIRYSRPSDMVYELNEFAELHEITLADISGVLMNALFLDALDADIERMTRINQTVELLSTEKAALHPYKLRKIPVLSIKPSRDLGALASDQFERFPMILKYLLRGTGASHDKGWDMLSYLSFDSSYTRALVEVGYEDALRQRIEIEVFFGE